MIARTFEFGCKPKQDIKKQYDKCKFQSLPLLGGFAKDKENFFSFNYKTRKTSEAPHLKCNSISKQSIIIRVTFMYWGQ